jgi:hypothetical protein
MSKKITISADEIKNMTDKMTNAGIGRLLNVSRQRIQKIIGRRRYFSCHISRIRHIREAVFWERVKLGGYDDCWPWNSGKGKGGYGLFRIHGKYRYAHQMAYEIVKGSIINGLWVLHKCNNSVCCNPNHLYLGTPTDNCEDRSARIANGELELRNGRYHNRL